MKSPVKKPVRKPAASGSKPLVTAREALGKTTPSPLDARPVGAKWGWHYRKLLAVRDRLLAEQGVHRTDAVQSLEPHSMDLADSATDEFDRDLTLAELSSEQNSLFEIDQALQRILNGTYGICEETGKPIPADRLHAIPWARFRKEIEDRLESQHLVNKPRLGNLGSVQRQRPANLSESEIEEEKPEPVAGDESLREISLPASLARQRNTPPPPLPSKVCGNAAVKPKFRKPTPVLRKSRAAKKR